MAKGIMVSSFLSGSTIATSATNYFQIGGSSLNFTRTSEGLTVLTFRSGGTMSNGYINVAANTITAASTLTGRKNSAAGNISVSIGASSTGIFVDDTNTDALSAGDTYDFQIATGSTGTSITIGAVGAVYAASSNTVTRFFGDNGTALGTNATRYQTLCGASAVTSTESNVQFKPEISGTLQNLYARATANNRNTSTTVRSRKNGANGNMSVSITSLSTGVFEDTVNTDSFVAADLLNYQIVTAVSTVGTITINTGSEISTTTGDSYSILGSQSTQINAGTSPYEVVGGEPRTDTTETDAQYTMKFTATAKNYGISVNTNNITNASTLTFRKNGANGNGSISVTASTSGIFEDTSNTDALVSGDKINTLLTTSGVNSLQLALIWFQLNVAGATTKNKTKFLTLLGVG